MKPVAPVRNTRMMTYTLVNSNLLGSIRWFAASL
jgi:hypothetical protein